MLLDNKYQLVAKIGRGGFSDVYLANDESGTQYAIKVYKTPKTGKVDLAAANREQWVMIMFDGHPNVLSCQEFVPSGILVHNEQDYRVTYTVLEYCANGTLSSVLARTGPLCEAVARFYLRQLISALMALHEKKVAHMDIKPQNVLVDEHFNLKLADFGTIEPDTRGDGLTFWKKGTDGYMAPEIVGPSACGPYNMFKADVYSLGVTFYRMLFGCHPNDDKNREQGLTTLNTNEPQTSLFSNSHSHSLEKQD
jgi:serine/threonine protein kinase